MEITTKYNNKTIVFKLRVITRGIRNQIDGAAMRAYTALNGKTAVTEEAHQQAQKLDNELISILCESVEFEGEKITEPTKILEKINGLEEEYSEDLINELKNILSKKKATPMQTKQA